MSAPTLSENVWRSLLAVRVTDPRAIGVAYAGRRGLGLVWNDRGALTSARPWPKSPPRDAPEAVFATTTLPFAVLGAAPNTDPTSELVAWGGALQLPVVGRHNVGKPLLSPPVGGVFTALDAAATTLRQVFLG